MLREDHEIRHALRRNGVGARALVALVRLGPCTIGRLSSVTGSSRQRVRDALMGRPPACRHEHSLRGLGFAKRHAVGGRVMFAATPEARPWAFRVERGLSHRDAVGRALRRVD